MSTDSAVSVSTATQVASSLPEVLQALGAFLNYPELRSCVLVCHQWNEVFTPWLWRIVEDYTLAWPRIIDQISPNFYSRYAVNNTVPSTKKDERWLRGMFVKHGRDVKGLHISSTPFLANASAAGTFTRLNSLTIHAITTYRPSEEAKALMDLPILAFKRNDDILLWDEQQAVISTCVLSPAFDNVLKPYAAMQLDAFPPCLMGSQRVCLLIMENPDLETVELGLETGVVAQFFSKEYVVGLLAALPRLKRFNNKCLQYDLQSMLEQLAGLQHYESHQHILNPLDFTLDNVALTRSFPGLRSLSLLGHGKVRAESVLNLLELLPGLEQLTLASLLPGLGNSSDSEEFIQDKKHGRLQGFHITYPVHNATRALDETISGLLPCMPFLTKISLRVLMPETAAVLAEQCKQLESLKVLDPAFPEPSTSSDVRTVTPPDNFPVLLLHGCPSLKHFVATRHTIHVDNLLERPIVCHGLETFCCRIVGVERLTSEEQAILDSATTTTPQDEKVEKQILAAEEEEEQKGRAEQIQEKYHRSLDQHRQIYDTFAHLTQLTTLDFGFEFLSKQRFNYYPIPPPPKPAWPVTYQIDGRVYIEGLGPAIDALSLSLNSGLDRLRSLSKLKTFGFKGLDHRVGAEELRWMVEAWPQLERVTGLNDFVGLGSYKVDCPKTRMLTEVLQSLRPGILLTAEFRGF